MATLIRMPEVAAGATEIVLSKWQVAVGASVKVGDVIAEMETERQSSTMNLTPRAPFIRC